MRWCRHGALSKLEPYSRLLLLRRFLSSNTALVLEFLGGYVESQRNRELPGFLKLGDDELLPDTAGSAAAMFLTGPSLMCAELRRGAGWIIASDGTARALPRHGHGGFASGCAH